jgi:hypothetical protein
MGSLLALEVLYSIWVGGDAWEWTLLQSRYVSVVLPMGTAIVVVGFVCLLTGDRDRWRHRGVYLLWISPIAAFGAGLQTNPTAFSPRASFGLAIVMALATLSIQIFVGRWQAKKQLGDASRVLFLGASMAVVATSVLPFTTSVITQAQAGPQVRNDAVMSETGMLLQDATKPGGRIALAWAGTTGYYSERQLVDMLGKSDRHVAETTPKPEEGGFGSSFVPGHSKWDEDWSIGHLRPDIVLDLPRVPPPSTMLDKLRLWGYTNACLINGQHIWVRSDSAQINSSKLQSC